MGRFRIPEQPADFEDHKKIVTDPGKVEPGVRFSEK